ncbi:MAG: 6,7-dimethyl-8-ribityllumazine synthase [Bacteroidia bacterium]|nr:6,7-dimethyl-8-ribityllumazine synthase [Bacteroidia bacterium]
MSSALKNLSSYAPETVPNGREMKIAVVVSEWNHEITGALKEGAILTLKKHGVLEENIMVCYVPGSFELPSAAHLVLSARTDMDAVICLGCVIQGETRHFDFICDAAAQGIKDVSLKFNKPVIFGVLTPNNQQQAADRAGGKHGNKGDEAAITALKMVDLAQQLNS